MKKLKKKIIYSVLIVLLMLTSKGYAESAFDIEEEKGVPVEESAKFEEIYSILSNKKLLASNGSYDLRDDLSVLRVKDQGNTENCWAFSTLSAIESNLLLTEKKAYDFSERHMNYSTTYNFKDGQTNIWGHNRNVKAGGNATIALSYITRGSGPVLEEDMPFSTIENLIDISEIQGKEVQKKVEDYILFPSITKEKQPANNLVYKNLYNDEIYDENTVLSVRDKIKKHIMTYGGVTAMTVSGSNYSSYYNYVAKDQNGNIVPTFYCNDSNLALKPNHQVLIIGWDDTYSKDNFNIKPVNDGAYLVLNSYGDKNTKENSNYPEGVYYISYDDVLIELGITGVINVKDIDYDHIYQYDPLGISTDVKVTAKEVYGENKFVKASNKQEILKEVSISVEHGAEADVYLLEDGSNEKKTIKKGVTLKQGYTTIKPDNNIIINSEKFSIIVRYYNKEGQNSVYMGVEKPNSNAVDNDYWKYATNSEGESFIGIVKNEGVEWSDIQQLAIENSALENANLCIKAFTQEVDGVIPVSSTYKITERKNIKYKSKYKLRDTSWEFKL